MQIGNFTKAAAFKSFLHQSYKSVQLLFLWQCFLIIFMRQTLTDDFWGLHKNKNCTFPLSLQLYWNSMVVVFWEIFGIFESYFQISSFIAEAYLEPNRKSMMDFLAKTVKTKSSIVDFWQGSKYISALVMYFSEVFFCFSTFMGKWYRVQETNSATYD